MRTPFHAQAKDVSSPIENWSSPSPKIGTSQETDFSFEDFRQRPGDPNVQSLSKRSPSFFAMQTSKTKKIFEINIHKTPEPEVNPSVTSLPVTENVIPTGSQLLRTPYVAPVPQEPDDSNVVQVPAKKLFATPAPSAEHFVKENIIPLGSQIPRTPFIKCSAEPEEDSLNSSLNITPAKAFSDSANLQAKSSTIRKSADAVHDVININVEACSNLQCPTTEQLLLADQAPQAAMKEPTTRTAVVSDFSTAAKGDDKQKIDPKQNVVIKPTNKTESSDETPNLLALSQDLTGPITAAAPEASTPDQDEPVNSDTDLNITKTSEVSQNKKQASKKTEVSGKIAGEPSTAVGPAKDEVESLPSPRGSLRTRTFHQDLLNQVEHASNSLEDSRRSKPAAAKRTRKVSGENTGDLSIKELSASSPTKQPRKDQNTASTSNLDLHEPPRPKESEATNKTDGANGTQILDVSKSRKPVATKRTRQTVHVTEDIAIKVVVEAKSESAPSPQKQPRRDQNTKINNRDMQETAKHQNGQKEVTVTEKSKPKIHFENASGVNGLVKTAAAVKEPSAVEKLELSSQSTAVVSKLSGRGRKKNTEATHEEIPSDANNCLKESKSSTAEQTTAVVEKLELSSESTAVVRKLSERGRKKNTKTTFEETPSDAKNSVKESKSSTAEQTTAVVEKLELSSERTAVVRKLSERCRKKITLEETLTEANNSVKDTKFATVEQTTAVVKKMELSSGSTAGMRKLSGRGRKKNVETTPNEAALTRGNNGLKDAKSETAEQTTAVVEKLELSSECTAGMRKLSGRGRKMNRETTLNETALTGANNNLKDSKSMTAKRATVVNETVELSQSSKSPDVAKKLAGRGRKKNVETSLQETATTSAKNASTGADKSLEDSRSATAEQTTAVDEKVQLGKSSINKAVVKKPAVRGRPKNTETTLKETDTTAASATVEKINTADVEKQEPIKSFEETGAIEKKSAGRGRKKMVDTTLKETSSNQVEETLNSAIAKQLAAFTCELSKQSEGTVPIEKKAGTRGQKKTTDSSLKAAATASNISKRNSRQSKTDSEVAVDCQLEECKGLEHDSQTEPKIAARGRKKDSTPQHIESSNSKAQPCKNAEKPAVKGRNRNIDTTSGSNTSTRTSTRPSSRLDNQNLKSSATSNDVAKSKKASATANDVAKSKKASATSNDHPNLKTSVTANDVAKSKKASVTANDVAKSKKAAGKGNEKSSEGVSKVDPAKKTAVKEEAASANKAVNRPKSGRTVEDRAKEVSGKVEAEPTKKPVKTGSRAKAKPNLDVTVCESIDPMVRHFILK